MIFLLRETSSSFSLAMWLILVDYPMGVWYQEKLPAAIGPCSEAGSKLLQMEMRKQDLEPPPASLLARRLLPRG